MQTADPEGDGTPIRTEALLKINTHPLFGDSERLMDVVTRAWEAVWTAKLGDGCLVSDLPGGQSSQLIGLLFESALARELTLQDPRWTRGSSKSDPDYVFAADPALGFQLKTCGQASWQVFGNKVARQRGYILAINYYKNRLSLVRAGYLSADDWVPQRSSTGNSSKLKLDAYKFKLMVIPGAYKLLAHPSVVRGVSRTTNALASCVRDLPDSSPAKMAFLQSDFYWGQARR